MKQCVASNFVIPNSFSVFCSHLVRWLQKCVILTLVSAMMASVASSNQVIYRFSEQMTIPSFSHLYILGRSAIRAGNALAAWRFMKNVSHGASSSCTPLLIHASLKAERELIINMRSNESNMDIFIARENVWPISQGFSQVHHYNGTTY